MTTGPLAVSSESLTGLPSVPFSAKSGAFCPTSRATAALARTRTARALRTRVRFTARMVDMAPPLRGCLGQDFTRNRGGGHAVPCHGHNLWVAPPGHAARTVAASRLRVPGVDLDDPLVALLEGLRRLPALDQHPLDHLGDHVRVEHLAGRRGRRARIAQRNAGLGHVDEVPELGFLAPEG